MGRSCSTEALSTPTAILPVDRSDTYRSRMGGASPPSPWRRHYRAPARAEVARHRAVTSRTLWLAIGGALSCVRGTSEAVSWSSGTTLPVGPAHPFEVAPAPLVAIGAQERRAGHARPATSPRAKHRGKTTDAYRRAARDSTEANTRRTRPPAVRRPGLGRPCSRVLPAPQQVQQLRLHWFGAPAPALGQAPVQRDAVEPGADCRAPGEPVEAPIGVEDRLLEDVFGVVGARRPGGPAPAASGSGGAGRR